MIKAYVMKEYRSLILDLPD